MKYIVQKDGKDFSIEIPDGSVIRSEPLPCSDGKASVSLLRVSVLNDTGIIADFLNVGSFYPETMTPKKQDWVTSGT